MSSTSAAAIVAAIGLLALSGCVASPPTTDPTQSSTEVVTPSPTPTLDPADASRWIVNFDGVGPVQLGKPFSPDLAEFAQFTLGTDQYCDPRVRDLKPGSGAALAYRVSITTRLADDQKTVGDYIGVSLTQPVSSPQILRTDKGIGIGSTEAETKAAYPTGVAKSIYGDGTYPYLSVPDGSGHFILFHFGGENTGPVSSISVQTFANDVYEFC